MRLPWSKHQREKEPREAADVRSDNAVRERDLVAAQRALEESRERLEYVTARGHEIESLSRRLKDLRQRNHFSEMVNDMLRGERNR